MGAAMARRRRRWRRAWLQRRGADGVCTLRCEWTRGCDSSARRAQRGGAQGDCEGVRSASSERAARRLCVSSCCVQASTMSAPGVGVGIRGRGRLWDRRVRSAPRPLLRRPPLPQAAVLRATGVQRYRGNSKRSRVLVDGGQQHTLGTAAACCNAIGTVDSRAARCTRAQRSCRPGARISTKKRWLHLLSPAVISEGFIGRVTTLHTRTPHHLVMVHVYRMSCPHTPVGPAPSSSSAAAAALRAALHAFLWLGQPATWCSRQQ